MGELAAESRRADRTSAAGTTLFEVDAQTLASLELNGDLRDAGPHHRDAAWVTVGAFVDTVWGQGVSLHGGQGQGLDWSAHASELVPPFTIEMVLRPMNTTCYAKLFGADDSLDAGFYYCHGVVSYPGEVQGLTPPGQVHYLAFVVQSPNALEVYFQGDYLGLTDPFMNFPVSQAFFFRDDSHTSRGEMLRGVVDGVRISRGARSREEIASLAKRLHLKSENIFR